MVKKVSLDELATGRDFKQASVGTQEARILKVIDIGMHANPQFPANKPKQQFIIQLELANDTVEIDGKTLPMTTIAFVGQAQRKKDGSDSKYTALLAASGHAPAEPLSLEKLIGAPVSVSIIEDKKDKSKTKVGNIGTVSARVAELIPPLVGESLVFDMDDPDLDIFENKLTEFQQAKIKEALNFQSSPLYEALQKKVGQQEVKDTGAV